MPSNQDIVVRVRAEIRGTECCVTWRQGQLSGDAEWIERACRLDPEVAHRGAVDVIHILEAAVGCRVALMLSSEDEPAPTSLAG